MEKVTNKDIAEYTDKSINTINGWKSKFPKLSEIVKLGAFCKKNGLDIEKIKKLVEIKEIMKDEN